MCNLCGGSRWKTLEEIGGTRVVRCDCGLVFVTPQPPAAFLEEAYDEAYYVPWEREARARRRMWERRLERVRAVAAKPGRLLDVGCGTGVFLGLAREHGWEVTGTEISRYAVKAAAAEGLAVVEGEIWEAELPAAAFDVVTCWHAIEHAADPRRVLEEIGRALRPGGWLVLATPNLEDHIFRAAYALARSRRAPLYEPDERELHLFHFSARTLTRLAVSAGFEVARVGFDRGAAVESGKRLVNGIAHGWFRLTGLNWGMGLELVARKLTARSEFRV